jgi:hypothetical protein
MKSMKGKKKNSKKDLGLNKTKQYKLPKGYRASCHKHSVVKLFKSITELQEHNRKEHKL